MRKIRAGVLLFIGMMLFGSGMYLIANIARTEETFSPRIAATETYQLTIGVTGISGSDDSHFSAPFGGAVSANGRLYVGDFNNFRVQAFDSGCLYNRTIASGDGTGNYELNKPAGMAVDAAGRLYVTDCFNNRVQVFDSNGVYLFTIGVTGVSGSDNAHFNFPEGVAVNATGYIYVADRSNHRVQVFDNTGIYQYTIGTGYGTGNYQFNDPKGAAVNATGYVYIADADNHRVQVFNKIGIYQYTIGVTGISNSDNNHFNQPKCVAVDATTGQLYVADWGNHRVQIFDKAGKYLSTIGVSGVSGSSNDKLYNPSAVALDSSGHIYVVDQNNHRVQVFGSPTLCNAPSDQWITILIVALIVAGIVSLGVVTVKKRSASGHKSLVWNEREQYGTGIISPPTTPPPPSSGKVSIHQRNLFIGGNVRIQTKVTNHGDDSILQAQFSLNLPSMFRLLRVEPPNYVREGVVVKFDKIMAGMEKEVDWIIEPLFCGKNWIEGKVMGTYAQGQSFNAWMDALEIDVRCPLFGPAEQIPLADVQQMFDKLTVKNERVYYMPKRLSPENAFSMVREIFSSRNVLFVGSTTVGEGVDFNQIAWFHGITKYRKKPFVFTGGVSEKDRTIRILSACSEEDGCAGTLAAIQHDLLNIASDTCELTCKTCGKALPRGPDTMQDVTCPECGNVYTTADFEH